MNQRTIAGWSVSEVIDACVRYGIPAVGLWREPVQDAGLEKTARKVKAAGLRVSSLCRAGFLTSESKEESDKALDSALRAIEEAAVLEAACLAIVAGGIPGASTSLEGARQRFRDGFDRLVPAAQDRGVKLGIEPLHPMFCADRSVIVTLADALAIASEYPADTVGVVVDSYNVWWDPTLDVALGQAGDRIFGYQVSDWVLPLADDPLLSRGMMGDGYIDFPSLGAKVALAGYGGDVEVEIFNQDLWSADPEEAVSTIVRRHAKYTHRGLDG